MKNNGDNGQQKEEKMEHNISEEPAESANTQAINNDDQVRPFCFDKFRNSLL